MSSNDLTSTWAKASNSTPILEIEVFVRFNEKDKSPGSRQTDSIATYHGHNRWTHKSKKLDSIPVLWQYIPRNATPEPTRELPKCKVYQEPPKSLSGIAKKFTTPPAKGWRSINPKDLTTYPPKDAMRLVRFKSSSNKIYTTAAFYGGQIAGEALWSCQKKVPTDPNFYQPSRRRNITKKTQCIKHKKDGRPGQLGYNIERIPTTDIPFEWCKNLREADDRIDPTRLPNIEPKNGKFKVRNVAEKILPRGEEKKSETKTPSFSSSSPSGSPDSLFIDLNGMQRIEMLDMSPSSKLMVDFSQKFPIISTSQGVYIPSPTVVIPPETPSNSGPSDRNRIQNFRLKKYQNSQRLGN